MKAYRIYEVNDVEEKLKGQITCRLDEDDKSLFVKLKRIGVKLNRRRNKIVWVNDDLIEIINKKSDRTIGIMEHCY